MDRISINAFLSHKYEASAINEFFFRLCSEEAEFHFDVDETGGSLNVTRVERMIRDADAFVGIYPFLPPEAAQPAVKDLLGFSRYFRFELEVAARSRRPGLIFVDSRYRTLLDAPRSIEQAQFKMSEIAGRGTKFTGLFTQKVRNLLDRVTASRQLSLAAGDDGGATNRAGILVPTSGPAMYTGDEIDLIRDLIEDAGFNCEVLAWPPALTASWIGKVREFDWMVVDAGPLSMSTGIIGYLHGEFKPSMRLFKLTEDGPPERIALYSGVPVGYNKDIVYWSTLENLGEQVRERIKALGQKPRSIATLDEAVAYFQEATKRKEAIFLSYSGKDREISAPLRDCLKRRFQRVFDYRDPKAIEAGEEWMPAIFNELSRAAIGIALYSSSYFQSGHCEHELLRMVGLKNEKNFRFIPLKIRDEDQLELPAHVADIQYQNLSRWPNVDAYIDYVVAGLDAKAGGGGKVP